MTTLRDLTPAQIRMMIRLDDGQPHEDSVGVEVDDLSAWQLGACEDLRLMGMVELRLGWWDSLWYRLTEAGRMVRKEGAM